MPEDYLIPDRDHTALVIIDTQKDFTLAGTPLEISGTREAVPQIQRLAQGFRNRCQPIIHVVRLYSPDGADVDLCRRRWVEEGGRAVCPGTEGAEIMDELKPQPGVKLDADLLLSGRLQSIGPMEWIMYKPRWGAFFKTMLEDHLRALQRTTLVICGCNFPNCPRTTIYEASERDFTVVMVPDALSGTYDQGLREMRNIGISLMTTDECLAWLG